MATKITVVVGANGEALASQAMRDGARADRLDTEATTKQARQAAADRLSDDTNGRENKRDKYAPSRDPAAFARKKREQYGQFAGVNISYMHFPLRGTWLSARDAAYMWINVRGITPEGQLKESQRIELTRNINTATFQIDAPEGYVNEEPLFSNTVFNNGFRDWPEYNVSLGDTWGPQGFDRYAVMPGSVRTDNGYFMQPFGSYAPLSPVVMPAIDGSTAFTIYEESFAPYDGEDYPGNNDAYNPNVKANGRTQGDVDLTGYVDFDKDPVHELFLLPYNGETTFLVVVFTDYMVATRSWLQSTATVQSQRAFSWPDETGQPDTNEVIYQRYLPNVLLPDGYEFPDFDFSTGSFLNGVDDRPRPQITEAGANKIQTVKLYKLTNGVMEEVEEVPTELRDAASALSTNLKGFKTKFQYPAERKYASERWRALWSGRGLEAEQFDGPDTSSWYVIDQSCNIMFDQDLKAEVAAKRRYLTDETRQRSIAKGYGIGRLSTGNHFDSPYINSELEGFWDDKYFTPMIYSYLKGTARPGMTYAQAAQGMPNDPNTGAPVQLNLFVDHNGSGQVRFTETRPSSIDSPETVLGAWQNEPAFNLSTHQCWNWNRPDLCWEELNSLGFGSDLIGAKP